VSADGAFSNRFIMPSLIIGRTVAAWWQGNPPRPPRGRSRPHLTVGQARGRPAMLRLVDDLRRQWRPVTFAVGGVSLIRRADPPDDVFRVAHRVLLGEAG
jgi:hypothetical protein